MKFPSYLYFSSKPRLPELLQAESAECGLVCLAMIANYYGHDVDLNGIRQRFQVSSSGANARHIIQIANQLSLAARALRVELETLTRVKCPAILHWGGDHFVVLREIGKGFAIIHDPARGKLKVPESELSSSFTGIVLEITPAASFEPIKARSPVKIGHLWERIHGLPTAIAQVIVISLIFQIVTFVLPLQMQLVIDEALGSSDSQILGIIAVGFIGLVALHALTESLRAWLLQLLGQQFIFQIIGNVVRHLLRLPTSFFEKRHLGDILSRMQSTRVIQDVLMRGLVAALIDGVMALVAVFLLFFYSTKLALISVVCFVLVTIVNFLYFSSLRDKTENQLVSSSKEQSFLMETIRAATTIKLLGKEAEREAAWRNMFIRNINLGLQISRIHINIDFFKNLINGIQHVAIVYFGARMILNSEGFSIGMLVTFLSFRQTFSDRATGLIDQISQFRLLSVHVGRIGEIVAQEPESLEGIAASNEVRGELELKNVSFSYGVTDPVVLQNINLHVRPGEFIAITGVSGGGKSTLLKLLLGLYPPTHGTIELDGLSATPELWRAWRTRMGVVAQEDKLFSGSIAENIAFFDPEMDIERVITAAKQAQIHDEINRKPMQYQTLIGDMGAALSGGQKQRLLLARAIYRSPSILLLDEGTANLDTANELLIADYLSSLNITRIIVAHRQTLIDRADRVYTLTGGVLKAVERTAGKDIGSADEEMVEMVA